MKKQLGFTVIEAALIIAVVAIIGGVGAVAYTKFQASSNSSPMQSLQTNPQPEKTVITSQKDIDSASSKLDNLTIDDTESQTLDQSTNDF